MYPRATSPRLQVLRSVLLPTDAGHGRRLWWKGGSSEDTEGHPNEDPHRPLLLLLPLLPPTHAHQVSQEGESSSKNRLPLPAHSKSVCWLSPPCFKPLEIKLVWNKSNDERVGIPQPVPTHCALTQA